MLAAVNLLLAVPAPGRAALPTCRPDPAYACDPRTFANGTDVCYFLPEIDEPAKPQCGCPKVRPYCAKDGWCYPSSSSPSRMAYNPFTKDAKCARCDGSFEAPMPKIMSAPIDARARLSEPSLERVRWLAVDEYKRSER